MCELTLVIIMRAEKNFTSLPCLDTQVKIVPFSTDNIVKVRNWDDVAEDILNQKFYINDLE